jgi:acetylornithine/N-succinyldiaminopimelate aminotransferase
MERLFWYPGYEIILPDIVRGSNCAIFDAGGKRHVDLESGVWTLPLGHGHPRILRVLAEQAARISHNGYNYVSPIVDESAEEILNLLSFDGGRCVFLCSGSEAVEYGVRTAQMISKRPLLMTMRDSYFGAYGSARERQESQWYSFDWLDCPHCPRDQGCSGDCERWQAIPFDRIGGFLFEPGSSSGLVRFPSTKLIRKIAATIKEGRGLILVNEVTTGMGRTGEWFGHQHYGITPDIVALGKGIGNGYPVAVAAMGPEVVGRMEGKPLPYSQSHQNDPLGAAVAREVIRTIREEGLVERSRVLGLRVLGGLNEIRERTGRIRALRGRGLMIAIEMEDGPDAARTRRVHRRLLERGYILGRRPGINVMRCDPSLTIEESDIDGFLRAFEEVCRAED